MYSTKCWESECIIIIVIFLTFVSAIHYRIPYPRHVSRHVHILVCLMIIIDRRESFQAMSADISSTNSYSLLLFLTCSKIQETSNCRWKCLIIAVELFSWGRCQCFRCVQMAWKTYWARTVEVFWVWQPFVSLCPLPLQVQQNLHIYGVLLYQRTREKRYPKFLSPFVTVSQALAAWLRLYLTNMYWTLKVVRQMFIFAFMK